MRSVGNDIVAFRAGDKTRTSRFSFYSKILTNAEQALYNEPQLAGMPFEHYVWLLWSVKESAYKYLKRNIPDLKFSPTGIVIQGITPPERPTEHTCTEWENSGNALELYRGRVSYGKHVFYFRSKLSQEWIATVVNNDNDFKNVYWGIRSVDNESYNRQSEAARTFVINRLNSFFREDFRIDKSPVGYPVIFKGMQNMHIPVSLAHDGLFVAYSFLSGPQDDN